MIGETEIHWSSETNLALAWDTRGATEGLSTRNLPAKRPDRDHTWRRGPAGARYDPGAAHPPAGRHEEVAVLLANKVAIITGAGPGLGRTLALLMAQEGARVIIAARTRETLESIA